MSAGLPPPLHLLQEATAAAAVTSLSPSCCVRAGETAPLRSSMHALFRGLLLKYRRVVPQAAWLRVCAAVARVLLTLRPRTCSTTTCSIGAPLGALRDMHGRAGGRAGEACTLCSTVLCIAEAVVSALSAAEAPVRAPHPSGCPPMPLTIIKRMRCE